MPLNVITDSWVALAVSLGLCLAALTVGRASGRPLRGAAVVLRALAMPAGVAALHVWITGPPVWPPVGVSDRLLLAIVLVAAIGLLTAVARRPATLGLGTAIATAVALVITLWPSLATEGAARGPALGFVVAGGLLAGASGLVIRMLEGPTARWPAVAIVSGLGLAAGAALIGSGNMKLGQFALGVGVAAGATGVLLVRKADLAVLSAPVVAGLALSTAILVAGQRYGELTLGPLLVLSACAAVGAVAGLLLRRRWRPGRAGAAAVVVAGLVAAVGVFLAVDLTGAEALDEYPY